MLTGFLASTSHVSVTHIRDLSPARRAAAHAKPCPTQPTVLFTPHPQPLQSAGMAHNTEPNRVPKSKEASPGDNDDPFFIAPESSAEDEAAASATINIAPRTPSNQAPRLHPRNRAQGSSVFSATKLRQSALRTPPTTIRTREPLNLSRSAPVDETEASHRHWSQTCAFANYHRRSSAMEASRLQIPTMRQVRRRTSAVCVVNVAAS